jgi:NADH:ubiquinone oxidoreductase subunit 6 (subunit J)
MAGMSYLAQSMNVGTQQIQGPLKGIENIGDVINILTLFLLPFAAVILLFVLLWGGYDFMTSAGNEEKVQGARTKITAGIIGFVLLAVSYIVVGMIAGFTGLGGGLFQ